MAGRLSLLRRFFSPFSIASSVHILSSLRCRQRIITLCKTYTRSSLLHNNNDNNMKKAPREGQGFFCTRAPQTEEAAAPSSSSLFSPYLSVRILCNKDMAVSLSESLLCFGANSASMDEDSSADLDHTWITCIFTDDKDVHACILNAADSIGLNCIPNYEVSLGEPCDWLGSIQESFHPIEITDGLWIIPKWKTPLDQQATNIILDPGLAFGTDHPTTKLCLLLLHDLIKGGEHIFDYGTGSGVLGIAAVQMGASFSVGIDIDPEAVTSARQNIALNNMDSSKMSVYLVPSMVSSPPIYALSNKNTEEQASENMNLMAYKGKFDIVVANLLLNPLMDLSEDIVSLAKPGAVIGLSGILSEQLQQVKEHYGHYLENMSASEMDGWVCLHGIRKKDLRSRP